jgi:hypothetical protein
MIRNLYKVLSEADEKPKPKADKKPKIEKEEPVLTVKLVDGKKTRDSIAVDFIGGGHEFAYPGVIPKGEIWIEQDLAPDEQADILVHELVEFALMTKGGMTYTPAHNMANKMEKVFRNFEGRWKTKQAPAGEKVEEAVGEQIQMISANELADRETLEKDALAEYGNLSLSKKRTVKIIDPKSLKAFPGKLALAKAFAHAEPWQKKLVAGYRKEVPTFPSGVIIVDGDTVVDGHHRAMAALLAGRKIQAIDLGDDGEKVEEAAKLTEDEAENTKGTCPKCGLAKHSAIPHLCSKGRSKWGTKGGKFTTPERPAYKTKVVEGVSVDKSWFGDSKVVDKNGKPLVVYHGTATPKTKFRDDRGNGMGGIYFTPSAKEAADLAENDVVDDDDTPVVIAAYVRIVNPVPDVHWQTRQEFSLAQKAEWMKQGYDGIIDNEEIVAFTAKQVKIISPNVYKKASKTIKESEGEDPLLVIVKQYASNKHPDDHLPEDYSWARDKAFNTEGLIHMMPGGLAGWRSFLGDAVKESPDKYTKLAKAEKIDDPVIISDGHIWDGWHRIAAAIVNGHKTIPAIVGRLNAR